MTVDRSSILFVESGTSGGGSFSSLHLLLQGLDPDRFRAVVVYLNDNRFVSLERDAGIEVHLLDDPAYSTRRSTPMTWLMPRLHSHSDRLLAAGHIDTARLLHAPTISALGRLVRSEQIGLIQLNNGPNRDLFGILAAQKAGVPCVCHLRSMRSGGFGPLRAAFANRHVSRFIANSEATRRYWASLGISGEKIQVVYNAIEADLPVRVDIRSEWTALARVGKIIGCVANFNQAKGHGFLLEAFAKLHARRPGCALLLVGDGPLRDSLRAQVEQLDISDAIVWAGYDARAAGIIAACDLAAIPSRSEGFSRAALEALKVGTPVVATDAGGLPEVIGHERNGLVAPHGDIPGFSAAMDRLLEDRELVERLTACGREDVRGRFSLAHHAERIGRIYQSVLE